MDRRSFFERLTAWSAGFCLAKPIFDARSILAAEANSRPARKPVLSVAKNTDYEALVGKVLRPLGGMKAFVKSGDRVVVKPNIGWDRTPEQAANTHPLVVKAVVRECLAAGAKQVLVFDRSVNDERRCYSRSGIQEAVASLGDKRAKCIFQDRKKFLPVEIKGGKSLKQFEFYAEALPPHCDCYINLPVAKHHSLSKLTLGLKNTMGVIGGNRGEIHHDIHQRIAELNLVIRPKLIIIDATRILLRHGPGGGNLDDVKVLDTLIASADPVAADAYATTLFDMKPEELGSTKVAAALGLGEMDLAKVEIVTA